MMDEKAENGVISKIQIGYLSPKKKIQIGYHWKVGDSWVVSQLEWRWDGEPKLKQSLKVGSRHQKLILI